MRIISIRRGFNSDHSSTRTEYIAGFEITCDYDWWSCDFEIPYDEKLFNEIKGYHAEGDYSLWIERRGKVIQISICVHLDYGNIHPRDPFIAYADYCMKIKENILAGDYSDLALLKAYVEGSKAEYKRYKSTSGIEEILDKSC